MVMIRFMDVRMSQADFEERGAAGLFVGLEIAH
jgi:hypothetical protein